VLVIAAGCGGGLPPAEHPEARLVVEPEPAKAEFYVSPSELGDAKILERIRHRVRLQRHGRVAVRPTGDAIQERPKNASTNGDDVLPVIDETRDRIRVVVEDDDARFALWIDREDTWLALAAPVQLADRHGQQVADVGVWGSLGAPVDVIGGATGRRRVRLRDELLALDGWVGSKVVDNVWVVAPGDRTPTDMRQNEVPTWSPPTDARPHGRLAKGAVLRARPAADGAVVATVTDPIIAVIVGRKGAWTVVEVVRPHARVRGFVATASITPSDDDQDSHGSGSGHGFGMSHADKIEVPAGTCLFDGREGEVIGVQLAKSVRLGHKHQDSWSLVYVDNPWSVASLYIRNTSSDPLRPSWVSCIEEPHR